MTPTTLSRRTIHTITSCVRSIDELDVLLWLARRGDRYGSADAIALETDMAPRRAAIALEGLAVRNLLEVRIADTVLYKIDPPSARWRTLVKETLDAARHHRTQVVRAIRTSPETARRTDPESDLR